MEPQALNGLGWTLTDVRTGSAQSRVSQQILRLTGSFSSIGFYGELAQLQSNAHGGGLVEAVLEELLELKADTETIHDIRLRAFLTQAASEQDIENMALLGRHDLKLVSRKRQEGQRRNALS